MSTEIYVSWSHGSMRRTTLINRGSSQADVVVVGDTKEEAQDQKRIMFISKTICKLHPTYTPTTMDAKQRLPGTIRYASTTQCVQCCRSRKTRNAVKNTRIKEKDIARNNDARSKSEVTKMAMALAKELGITLAEARELL